MKEITRASLRCRELPLHTPPPFGGLLVLLPLTLALSLLAGALFDSLAAPWWALAAGGMALQVLLWLLDRQGFGGWLLPGGAGLLLLLCLAAHGPLAGSAGYLLSDLARQLTAVTGRIHLDFAASGSSLPAALLLAFFTGLLLHESWRRESPWPLIPVLLPVLAAYVLGLATSVPLAAALLLGSALLCLPRSRWQAEGLRLAAAGLCLLLCVGAAALWGGLCEGASASLHQALHTLRYDTPSHSMPEGQLQDLGPWEPSDTPALAVTMEQPERLYLRGGIYEVYTGSAWQPAAADSRAAYADLFYWLHHNEFYGQTQLGDAAALIGQTENNRLTVENLSACRAHGYLPYGAVQLQPDAALIGDAVLPVADSIPYLSGGTAQWYDVQAQLVSSQQQKGDYVALERAWWAYVSAQDLQLTQDSWAVLERQLGQAGQSHSLQEILTLIRSYLAEQLSYDASAHSYNGQLDFLSYLLESSGTGYSVHYATAATLLLRYFGVPARYVEGYCLTSAQAAQLRAGEQILLTEENAHAWAEYYLEGVGFIPFEVTPGYMEQEDLETGSGQGQDGTVYTPDHSSYTVPQQTPQPQGSGLLGLLAGRWWYLLAAALLVLAALVLLRRRRLTRPLRHLRSCQGREAVTAHYGYAVYLLRLGGPAPPEEAEARLRNQEARFSDHPVTEEQVQWMRRFAADCLAACRSSWSIPRRLYYRWIKCVY